LAGPPDIQTTLWPGPPEPDRASRFQFKPDRYKHRAGRAGPKIGRAWAGFGPFGPEWPSLIQNFANWQGKGPWSRMEERMAAAHSACREGPVHYPLSPVDCSAWKSRVVNIPVGGFCKMRKSGNVSVCRAPTSSCTAERVSAADPACRVGLVRYSQGVV